MSGNNLVKNEDSEIFLSTCPRDCYDACGLKIKKKNNVVVQIAGDPQHPVSRGRLCRKCSIGYNSIWLDPSSRLTEPLQRIGAKGEGKFKSVSWDKAITDITDRIKQIIKTSGAETILNTHYTGTFAAIGYHFPMRFFNRMGATEVNPDSVCNLAGHVALDYIYGSSLTGFDPRTEKDSKCIVVWGANPYAAGPHTYEHWLQKSSSKLVVVDPIRTQTAAIADLHLQPFPGSDAALAFSIMHVLNREGWINKEFVSAYTIGWEQLERQILQCTPEWGECVTGVSALDIIKAAQLYAEGPSLLWLGQGFQRQPRGGNAIRACAMLPAITGNIGKPGAGFLYLNGLGQRGIDDNYLLGTDLLKKDTKSISHMDLAAYLEDPELSKGLFCWNINNVASSPEQSRLRKALARNDLFTVVADVFPTDTTDYADYVLPAASFFESDDLFASYFNLSLSAQVKVTEPMGESLPNSEIFRRIAKSMEYQDKELHESDSDIINNLLKQSNVDETFESLKLKGTVNVSAEPVIQFEGLKFSTPSGKIEIVSEQAEKDGLPLMPEPHADKRPNEDYFRLITSASPWSLNASFGNVIKIDKQQGAACVILHPDEANRLKLVESDQVRLFNDTGELKLQLKLSTDIPHGVALSHKGRWPKRQETQANVNVLNPGNKTDMGESSSVHGTLVRIAQV